MRREIGYIVESVGGKSFWSTPSTEREGREDAEQANREKPGYDGGWHLCRVTTTYEPI